MKEYSIRIDGVVLGHGFVYGSRAEAEDMIRKMADADRVYDIPDSPKRVVVEREVPPWRAVTSPKRKPAITKGTNRVEVNPQNRTSDEGRMTKLKNPPPKRVRLTNNLGSETRKFLNYLDLMLMHEAPSQLRKVIVNNGLATLRANWNTWWDQEKSKKSKKSKKAEEA